MEFRPIFKERLFVVKDFENNRVSLSFGENDDGLFVVIPYNKFTILLRKNGSSFLKGNKLMLLTGFRGYLETIGCTLEMYQNTPKLMEKIYNQ